MKTKFVALLLLLIFQEVSGMDIPELEYRVFSEFLNKELGGDKKAVYILSDKFEFRNSFDKDITSQFSCELVVELYRNHYNRFQDILKIGDRLEFADGVNVILKPENEIETHFELHDHQSWSQYGKEIIGFSGMICLSRIGFSANKREALFYYSITQGGLSGWGWIVHMKEFEGHWKEVSRMVMWTS